MARPDCENNFIAHSPATGLSHLQIHSPQALSPNPSAMLLSSGSSQRAVSPVAPPNCPPSSPYMQRIQHNQEENQQQALSEQNINDFIKSILAPDSPGRLSDLGSNIFFDGSTRTSGSVCTDSAISEAAPPVEKDSEERDNETKDNNLVTSREEESTEGESGEITESLQKLDIAE